MNPPESADQAHLEQLRALLLDSDRREIEELRERLEEVNALETIIQVDKLKARLRELEAKLASVSHRTEQVAEVLPAAIEHRRTARDDLTDALRPDIERALHDSIRRDPTVMAEALYPVMGPTIRKLIASMFSIDQPGATYQIRNAYLIDRRTSLPIAVHDPASDGLEADMVSGMLEALRSFVQDAFEAEEFDGLHDLRVGDVNLWVEWGPQAVLAVVVRGTAPESLRLDLQEMLERVHGDYRHELDLFIGDTAPFAAIEPQLGELTERLARAGAPGRARRFVPLVVLVLVLVAIGVLVWFLVT